MFNLQQKNTKIIKDKILEVVKSLQLRNLIVRQIWENMNTFTLLTGDTFSYYSSHCFMHQPARVDANFIHWNMNALMFYEDDTTCTNIVLYWYVKTIPVRKWLNLQVIFHRFWYKCFENRIYHCLQWALLLIKFKDIKLFLGPSNQLVKLTFC